MYDGKIEDMIGKWWFVREPSGPDRTDFFILDIVTTGERSYQIHIVDEPGFEETYHRTIDWLRNFVHRPNKPQIKNLNREFIKNWFHNQG